MGACLKALQNLHLTLECMWPQLTAQDMELHLKGISLVVGQGRHDNCTSSSLVEQWMREQLTVDTSAGHSAQLVWF